MLDRRLARYLPGLVPGLVAAATLCGLQGTAQAHFILQSPPASLEQGSLGDPQKAPPCGDDGSATQSGVVTTYQAGQTITVTIDERIPHPGHYRISLAASEAELPPEPPVTAGATACGSAPIDPAPVFPVLADGVFEHTEAFAAPQSIDITLPADFTCTNCTLQVLEFMSNHGLNNPGGCYYHHCAQVSIEGGPSGSSSTGGDESTSGDATTSNPMTTTTPPGTTTDPSGGTSAGSGIGDSSSDDGGSSSGAVPSTTVTIETDSGEGDGDSDSGCGCSAPTSPGQAPVAAMFTLLGLFALRARRRG